MPAMANSFASRTPSLLPQPQLAWRLKKNGQHRLPQGFGACSLWMSRISKITKAASRQFIVPSSELLAISEKKHLVFLFPLVTSKCIEDARS